MTVVFSRACLRFSGSKSARVNTSGSTAPFRRAYSTPSILRPLLSTYGSTSSNCFQSRNVGSPPRLVGGAKVCFGSFIDIRSPWFRTAPRLTSETTVCKLVFTAVGAHPASSRPPTCPDVCERPLTIWVFDKSLAPTGGRGDRVLCAVRSGARSRSPGLGRETAVQVNTFRQIHPLSQAVSEIALGVALGA